MTATHTILGGKVHVYSCLRAPLLCKFLMAAISYGSHAGVAEWQTQRT
jgi:hypothetical protein